MREFLQSPRGFWLFVALIAAIQAAWRAFF
jgi:hypothetical protein